MAIDFETFTVRVAIEEDVPGIRRAIRSSILGLAARDYPREVLDNWGKDSPEASAKQREAIRDGRELTWVAERANAIAGFSALDPVGGIVRAVYVAQEAARRGVATRLLAELERNARLLGISRLTMDSSITAEPFYLRNGYSKLGERIHQLASGVPMTAVLMAKELR